MENVKSKEGPKCPHCGYIYDTLYHDFELGDHHDVECPECHEYYFLEVYSEFIYESSKK